MAESRSQVPVDALLSVDRLTTRYGLIEAVRSVSIQVREGEIVAVLGPNGAGKSTILMSVMGLVKPASGTVNYEGKNITRMEPEAIVRLGLSLVPEHRRIFKNLSVRENLNLGTAGRRGRGDAKKDLDDLLQLFPILAERMDQMAGFLSGGEAQQLAIARAIMSAPRLLLLDEPSLGLAPLLVDAVFELIARLRDERGLTILLVEQNALQVLDFVDRTYILRNGEIALEAAAADLADEAQLLQAYLGLHDVSPEPALAVPNDTFNREGGA
jgi:branched-chain amino acid transport system ATP-binding protein